MDFLGSGHNVRYEEKKGEKMILEFMELVAWGMSPCMVLFGIIYIAKRREDGRNG